MNLSKSLLLCTCGQEPQPYLGITTRWRIKGRGGGWGNGVKNQSLFKRKQKVGKNVMNKTKTKENERKKRETVIRLTYHLFHYYVYTCVWCDLTNVDLNPPFPLTLKPPIQKF